MGGVKVEVEKLSKVGHGDWGLLGWGGWGRRL